MKWTGLNEIRESYLSFFETKEHLRLGSYPLVPQGDKSLLLINSGMAPMKQWFLGQAVPPSPRVTTCQKCIRTPDIERVGITARHGTFFEMLGNFSFQNYFKKEAIKWAWEFLTVTLEIPKDKLFVSIYEDDDEAFEIWRTQENIPAERIVRFGKEDNFWEHGSGPCGPCSEIYFDRGVEFGCGGADCKVGCDCDRFMEVWNLVFTQFNSDGKGTYTLLDKPNIDTGMGLERLACVMQGVSNLFEVDTVRKVIDHVEKITGKTYGANEKEDISIRVITDHIRSTVFMVSDGVVPSNEGRGYVLRRLLRRAARHGLMLGVKKPFLKELCDTVINENKAGYPELLEHADYIKKIINVEEERFSKTIDQGMNVLNNLIDAIEKDEIKNDRILSGSDAFKLNDTFGFPIDLTKEIMAENNIKVDEDGFHIEMQKQRDTARADRAKKSSSSWAADLFKDVDVEATKFVGYDNLTSTSTVVAISDGEEIVDAISIDDESVAKDNILVILDTTPFYAESGGQTADHGVLEGDTFKLVVKDCTKTAKGYFVHNCILEKGSLSVGTKCNAVVEKTMRMQTARNHTAGHLLQQALRDVLGNHVHQAGQLVNKNVVRFDFTHFASTTSQELLEVEKIVNEKIFESLEINISEMPIKDAKNLGAMALFGEKYGDIVRVVNIDGYSIELCGGTHVSNASQIGCFKIISESSVAAGIRRIEAVTGTNVLKLLSEKEAILQKSCDVYKVNKIADLPTKLETEKEHIKLLQEKIENLETTIANRDIDKLFENAIEVKNIKVLTAFLMGTSTDYIRKMAENATSKIPESVCVFVNSLESKMTMVVACGKQAITEGLKAGDLVKELAKIAGGNGGGKPTIAMAGLRDKDKIDDALFAATKLVEEKLK